MLDSVEIPAVGCSENVGESCLFYNGLSKMYLGGRHVYGEVFGILLMHKLKARIPGDIGNAATFNFPVCYTVVEEATGSVHRRADPSLVDPLVRAAQSLERRGVRAIATSCGFLSYYHDDIAMAVDIPVVSSSLLQIPLISKMMGGQGKIAVLTAEGGHLDERYFQAVGAEKCHVVVAGMENQPEFRRAVLNDGPELDPGRLASEVGYVASETMKKKPGIKAIVLECVQLSPYAHIIQEVTSLPVFDIITLIESVYHAINRHPFTKQQVFFPSPVSRRG